MEYLFTNNTVYKYQQSTRYRTHSHNAGNYDLLPSSNFILKIASTTETLWVQNLLLY
jgi:hypothetical protein